MDSLSCNFVLHIIKDTALLDFYKKSREDFLKDSIVYFNAVASFFNADRQILEKLLLFQGDSAKCNWVSSPSPYSSTIRAWEINLRNEEGVKVLIYDYIMHHCDGRKKITTSPGLIEDIIETFTLKDMKSWIAANKNKPLKVLCTKLQDEIAKQFYSEGK
ncbi:hypothetical protein EG028_17700 [Chitinophaga barathri]|uniref:Uncharacterized protein n=2 Tax=Chitinophaga barathri TaxID=1647451 RepID=A0A3N4MEB6_9BACT|nr:hypothetical protein EG028_17700 [Chitinophaga barathri]